MQSMVVKIGSSSVTRATGPDPVLLASALDAALSARSLGWSVILVSSGAVSSGLAYLNRTKGLSPSKRLAAAVGQPFLMDVYRSVSEVAGEHICQVLVSESDLLSPSSVAAAASVFAECSEAGIIPIVNGNDAMDSQGSDNDAVAVAMAVASGADKLLLLTDVPGVFPEAAQEPAHLSDLKVSQLRGIAVPDTGAGKGGMRSKLRAAELAAYNGIETHIASAWRPSVILQCIRGESVGTRVMAERDRYPAEDRWISGIAISHGAIVINRAAEESIKSGTSLFASGIKRVRGQFRPGDIIDITAPDGTLLARGASKISAPLMELVRSMRTDEIATVMTEILEGFQRGSGPGPEVPGGAKAPSSERVSGTGARRQLTRALASLDSMGNRGIRRLALEIVNLFPSATVNAMLGTACPPGAQGLMEFYANLSSDLSLIDRERLVVF
jgi:glutamate 5-kinase